MKKVDAMHGGKVIFLNGTSSSGKSTTALALQKMLDEPFLRFSSDILLESMDRNVTGSILQIHPSTWTGEALCFVARG
jgi:chloramphenicol 3-O-phosphotransferase